MSFLFGVLVINVNFGVFCVILCCVCSILVFNFVVLFYWSGFIRFLSDGKVYLVEMVFVIRLLFLLVVYVGFVVSYFVTITSSLLLTHHTKIISTTPLSSQQTLDRSRLGCQVIVKKQMDGWEIVVPTSVDAR